MNAKRPKFHDLPQIVERAKLEILSDVADGVVPATAKSFAELHDYVDANEYGGAFEFDFGGEGGEDKVQADCDFWNAVHDACDKWIKDGGLKAVLPQNSK